MAEKIVVNTATLESISMELKKAGELYLSECANNFLSSFTPISNADLFNAYSFKGIELEMAHMANVFSDMGLLIDNHKEALIALEKVPVKEIVVTSGKGNTVRNNSGTTGRRPTNVDSTIVADNTNVVTESTSTDILALLSTIDQKGLDAFQEFVKSNTETDLKDIIYDESKTEDTAKMLLKGMGTDDATINKILETVAPSAIVSQFYKVAFTTDPKAVGIDDVSAGFLKEYLEKSAKEQNTDLKGLLTDPKYSETLKAEINNFKILSKDIEETIKTGKAPIGEKENYKEIYNELSNYEELLTNGETDKANEIKNSMTSLYSDINKFTSMIN